MKMISRISAVALTLCLSAGSVQAQYGGMFPPFTPGFWGLSGWGYSPWMTGWNSYPMSYGASWGGAADSGFYAANYLPSAGFGPAAGCCIADCQGNCGGNCGSACGNGCGTGCADGSCTPSGSGTLQPSPDSTFDSGSDSGKERNSGSGRDSGTGRDGDRRYEDILDTPAENRRNGRGKSTDDDVPAGSGDTDPGFRRSPGRTNDGESSRNRDNLDSGGGTFGNDKDSGRDTDAGADSGADDRGTGSDLDFPDGTFGGRRSNKPPMTDALQIDPAGTSNESAGGAKDDAETGTKTDVDDFLSPIEDPAEKSSAPESSPDSTGTDADVPPASAASDSVTRRGAVRKNTSPIVSSRLRDVVPASRLAGRRPVVPASRQSSRNTEQRPVRWISLPSPTGAARL